VGLTSEVNPSRVKAGDVFVIRAPDGRYGLGQVISPGGVMYIAVFAKLYDGVPNADEVLSADVLLVGWTVDALFHHGRWKVIGSRPVVGERFPYPSYKVVVEGEIRIRDFSGTHFRRCNPDEEKLVDYKTTIAPIRYQRALLAYNGIGQWDSDFDPLTVKHARDRIVKI
jgi:Immunity protein 26